MNAIWLICSAAWLAPECVDCEKRMPAVVASGQRTDARAEVLDNASRIDVIELRQFKPGLDLVEALAEVPGLVARDRFNFAQDTQISVRGFGARSAFGVRGVRIEYDGIPATAADGQSQVGHIQVDSVSGIEVIRGPFAALYGNGGAVIRIDRDLAATERANRASLGAGSDAQARIAAALNGGEAVRYALSANHFRTDGHREHSSAERTQLDVAAQTALGEHGVLSFSGNQQSQPDSADPQGLTREEFERNPSASSPAATIFNTRKSVTQSQVGVGYQHAWATAQVQLSTYAGQRQIDQFLSVPVAAQAPASSGGGVIDLGRDYSGVSLRGVQTRSLALGDLRLSAEWRIEQLDEARLGYENFRNGELGVRGSLRRDEANEARVIDGMVRVDWMPSADWTLSAGVRRHRTDYRSRDDYIAAGNPDDSGRYGTDAWLPVAGLHYSAAPSLELRASAARSHEAPTLAELAYRSDGESGFNGELRPTRARQWELGAFIGDGLANVDLSLFQIDSQDEIVADSTAGGRSSFRNAEGTRRRGVELASDWSWAAAWRLRAVLSYIDARYQGAETTPTLSIRDGQRIPGVAPRQALVELLWRRDERWNGALELRALDDSAASDRNDDRVPGYAALNLRLNRAIRWGDDLELSAQFRIDNMLDQSYSASLIVNDSNARYFEPAPGRRFWLGLEMRFL